MTTMNLYDMTDTWNAAGTTFTGIGLSVTDTASASGSLLLDLRVGGTSRFRVEKSGRAVSQEQIFGTRFYNTSNATQGFVFDSGLTYADSASGFVIRETGAFAGVTLSVDAADTLAQRRGTNAQAFRIYGTYTDASNWERLSVGYAAESLGNQFVVAHAKAGSGTNRNLWMGTLGSTSTIIGTNGTGRWTFNENGHFVANADNTYDIGASGATRPRSIYFGTSIRGSGFIEVGSGQGISWLARAQLTSPSDGVVMLSNNAITDFNRLQFGGTSSSFPALKRSGTTLAVRLADDTADAPLTASALVSTASPVNTTSIAALGYSLTGSDASSLLDVSGTWDTTGTPTLLKANVTDTASNAASLLLDLQVGGTSRVAVTKGGHIVQAGSYHEMAEMTAPAAPATNGVRIYAEDNGSGKTRLMARFATGSAVQIAIEP
jgi:hypothetical protein